MCLFDLIDLIRPLSNDSLAFNRMIWNAHLGMFISYVIQFFWCNGITACFYIIIVWCKTVIASMPHFIIIVVNFGLLVLSFTVKLRIPNGQSGWWKWYRIERKCIPIKLAPRIEKENEWVSEWVNANRVIASHSIALQNVHSAIIQLICNSIKFCVIFRTECLSIFKIESECDMVVTESTAVYWENEHERCGSKSKTGSWRSFEMRIGKNERKRLLTYFNLMEPILNGEHFYTAQSTTINENPTTALISSIKKNAKSSKSDFQCIFTLIFLLLRLHFALHCASFESSSSISTTSFKEKVNNSIPFLLFNQFNVLYILFIWTWAKEQRKMRLFTDCFTLFGYAVLLLLAQLPTILNTQLSFPSIRHHNSRTVTSSINCCWKLISGWKESHNVPDWCIHTKNMRHVSWYLLFAHAQHMYTPTYVHFNWSGSSSSVKQVSRRSIRMNVRIRLEIDADFDLSIRISEMKNSPRCHFNGRFTFISTTNQ